MLSSVFRDMRLVLTYTAHADCKKQEALEHKHIKNQFGGEDTENENL